MKYVQRSKYVEFNQTDEKCIYTIFQLRILAVTFI